MAPAKIVQTRGGWPFFEVDVTAAKANPADSRVARAGTAPNRVRARSSCGGSAVRPRLSPSPPRSSATDSRLTTGAGSYDSLIVEFPDHIMMLEAGQNRGARARLHRRSEEDVPEQADPLRDEHAPALGPHGRAAGARGRRRHDRHAREQQGVLRAGAQHAAHAARRHAGEEPEEGEGRNRGGEEGLLGRNAHRRDLPHLPGAALERAAGRVHPEGEDAVPGRLLAAGTGAAGERSRQGAGAGAREAQPVEFERYINVHASATPQTKAELWKAVGK